MPSIYNNSSNIYRSDFKSVTLTDIGTFSLPEDIAKSITIFQDSNTLIRVFKTTNTSGNAFSATSTGTSDCDGIHILLEDGVAFDVPGVANANEISLQLDNVNDVPTSVKYIVER